jgi:hypothetical protein
LHSLSLGAADGTSLKVGISEVEDVDCTVRHALEVKRARRKDKPWSSEVATECVRTALDFPRRKVKRLDDKCRVVIIGEDVAAESVTAEEKSAPMVSAFLSLIIMKWSLIELDFRNPTT